MRPCQRCGWWALAAGLGLLLASRVTGAESDAPADLYSQPPLVLKVGNLPSRKRLWLEASATTLRPRCGPEALQLRIEVVDSAGVVRLTRGVAAPEDPTGVAVEYGELPAGPYVCRVMALAGARELATGQVPFRHLAPPVWLSDRTYDDYGQAGRVPKPWTALQYGPAEVSAWGRALRWTGFAGARARDARSGEVLSFAKGVLHLTVGPESFRLLRFEPSDG